MRLPTLLVGAGTLIYCTGASALALGGEGTVDYQTWIQTLLGLLIAVIGAYVRGVSERVADNAREIDALRAELSKTQVAIAVEHHTKDEANAAFQELKASINAIHRRLDFFQLPRGLGPAE